VTNPKALVVGCGVMGSHHARIYSDLQMLAGVCDSDVNRASFIGEKYKVPYFVDLDLALSSLKNDSFRVASIAVPTPFHFNVTNKCLSAGYHVLLEKPAAESIQEINSLGEKANALGLVLSIGYIELFNPAFQKVEELFNDGFFGEITSITIRRVGGIPRSADNVIFDLMTHDFSLVQRLLKKIPDRLTVYQRRKSEILVDSAQALLGFGPISVFCEANWISPIKIRNLIITGTSGYCKSDLIQQSIQCFGKKLNSLQPFSNEVDSLSMYLSFKKEPLREEILNFVNFIKDKSGIIVSAFEASQVLETTLRAIQLGGQ